MCENEDAMVTKRDMMSSSEKPTVYQGDTAALSLAIIDNHANNIQYTYNYDNVTKGRYRCNIQQHV